MATATTDRIYERLPEHYRRADDDLDQPLYGYLSLEGDQVDELAVLAGRLGTDLADPAAADDAWLPWLLFLIGINAMAFDTPAQRRLAALNARFDAGSLNSLIALIEAFLAHPIPTDAYRIVRPDGSAWLIGIYFQTNAVGFTTWNTLEVDHPTWTDVETPGSWNAIAPSGDFIGRADVEAIRPAGHRFNQYIQDNTWLWVDELGSWNAVEALGSWTAIETGGV